MGVEPDPALVTVSRKVVRAIEGQLGVEGVAVIGALARNLYAAPRATGDVDLAVALRDGEAYKRVVQALVGLGFVDRGATQDYGDAYPALAHFDGPVELDLLIAHTEFEHSAVRDRVILGSGEDGLPTVTPGDLIFYKLLRFGAQDKADIEEVMKAAPGEVDWERAARFAEDFGVEDRVEWARGVSESLRARRGPKL